MEIYRSESGIGINRRNQTIRKSFLKHISFGDVKGILEKNIREWECILSRIIAGMMNGIY